MRFKKIASVAATRVESMRDLLIRYRIASVVATKLETMRDLLIRYRSASEDATSVEGTYLSIGMPVWQHPGSSP